MSPFAAVLIASTLLPVPSPAAAPVAPAADTVVGQPPTPADPASMQAVLKLEPDEPKGEFHVGVGIWNMMGGSGTVRAGLLTRRASFLATDVAFEIGRTDYDHPQYEMVAVGVRLAPPETRSLPTPTPFLEVGEAYALNLSFVTSPYISVGLQKWRLGWFATRVEGQFFLKGHGVQDSARLLVSLAIPLE